MNLKLSKLFLDSLVIHKLEPYVRTRAKKWFTECGKLFLSLQLLLIYILKLDLDFLLRNLCIILFWVSLVNFFLSFSLIFFWHVNKSFSIMWIIVYVMGEVRIPMDNMIGKLDIGQVNSYLRSIFCRFYIKKNWAHFSRYFDL